jgi:Fuc2NAc and GlcNAc transferase
MLITLLFFFIISLCLTYLVLQLAIKKNIIDNPNERSSHSEPTPRGGGLAIVVIWFGGLIYLYINGWVEQNLFFALLSGLVLAIVSLLDDILGLKPLIRIFAQGASVIGALIFLGGLYNLPYLDNSFVFWLLNAGVFVGFIWFINLYNFLDGIDAYSSQETILIALGFLIITGNPVLGLLIASVAGFLVWNWPKAKIFMGDVGSTQLGFIIVVLGIYFHNKMELNIIHLIILSAVFWFDASFTLFLRLRNKENLSLAHKKHAYQRLVQSGYSHLKVTVFAIGLNLILVTLSVLNHFFLHQGIYVLGIVLILLFYINSQINRIFPFKQN